MNFFKYCSTILLTSVALAFLLIVSCSKGKDPVSPGSFAKVSIQLVFPESVPESLEKSNTISNIFEINAIDEVTVSVINSQILQAVITEQPLTIVNTAEGRFAEGEIDIPVSEETQSFKIVVFASDLADLKFFMGASDITLKQDQQETEEISVEMGLAPSITSVVGTVTASSTFPEGDFVPQRGADLNFGTSWFSGGVNADPNGSTYTWSTQQRQFIGTVGIFNNSRHNNPEYRTGFGFETVTFQVFEEANGAGDLLFEATTDYPKTAQVPAVRVSPMTLGRSVKLILKDHENDDRGGFGELLIVNPLLPPLPLDNVVLQSLAITPENPEIGVSQTQQFTATGTFSDNSSRDITSEVTWSSSNTNVATITSAGLATGEAAGTTTIQASRGGVSGQTTLTVSEATLVSIAVTPTDPTIEINQTQQFTATGTFSDNSTRDLTDEVTWSSSNTNVATISSGGVATGEAVGTTTIQASQGGVSDQTTLTVSEATLASIEVTPTDPTIEINQTQQFTATGTFSDNSTRDITSEVMWTSTNTDVASINSNGLANGLSAGTTTIRATKDNVSGETRLTVEEPTLVAIDVSPKDSTIKVDGTLQYIAIGTFSNNSTQNLTGEVIWASSNTNVANINNSGLATAMSAGMTSISATKDNVSGSTSLTVITGLAASISGLQYTLAQLNDSTNCVFQSGNVGSLFELTLDYNDPDGDVTNETVVNVSFVFNPSGNSGSFQIPNPTVTGNGFQGSMSFFICALFSTSESIDVTVTITDAGGQESNALTINIQKPQGANSIEQPKKRGVASRIEEMTPACASCPSP